jgi:hypothetical protein
MGCLLPPIHPRPNIQHSSLYAATVELGPDKDGASVLWCHGVTQLAAIAQLSGDELPPLLTFSS